MEIADLIFERIERYPTIALFGHVFPDPDCYGCQVGLRDLLRARFPEKKIFALGSGVPKLFPLLGEMDQVEEKELEGALGIVLDVSTLARVECPYHRSCAEVVKIDHHEMGPNDEAFPGLALVDTSRVACGEILTELAQRWGLAFSSRPASALYTGILTDSGRFVYDGTTRRTFDAVGFLFRFGIPAKSIIDTFYYEEPNVKEYKAWMKAHALCQGQVCYLYAKAEDYQAFGLPFEKASALVNTLNGLYKAKLYVYFCERGDGFVRVEYRSNKRYPVVGVAQRFGGGGHRYASGSEIHDGSPNYLDIVEAMNQVKGDE